VRVGGQGIGASKLAQYLPAHLPRQMGVPAGYYTCLLPPTRDHALRGATFVQLVSPAVDYYVKPVSQPLEMAHATGDSPARRSEPLKR